jgi:hypothetical protein
MHQEGAFSLPSTTDILFPLLNLVFFFSSNSSFHHRSPSLLPPSLPYSPLFHLFLPISLSDSSICYYHSLPSASSYHVPVPCNQLSSPERHSCARMGATATPAVQVAAVPHMIWPCGAHSTYERIQKRVQNFDRETPREDTTRSIQAYIMRKKLGVESYGNMV